MFELKTHLVEQVWQKAGQIEGMDPANFRTDDQGSVISKAEFNNEYSIYGWCLNHLKPFWEGGSNDIGNVTPLNCTNKIMSLATYINKVSSGAILWD